VRGGPGDLGDGEAAGGGVGDDDGVGRRRGREEGEARGDGGCHAAHACRLPLAQRVRWRSTCSCAAASWHAAACDAMRGGFVDRMVRFRWTGARRQREKRMEVVGRTRIPDVGLLIRGLVSRVSGSMLGILVLVRLVVGGSSLLPMHFLFLLFLIRSCF
jgi:hypothetical protein